MKLVNIINSVISVRNDALYKWTKVNNQRKNPNRIKQVEQNYEQNKAEFEEQMNEIDAGIQQQKALEVNLQPEPYEYTKQPETEPEENSKPVPCI